MQRNCLKILCAHRRLALHPNPTREFVSVIQIVVTRYMYIYDHKSVYKLLGYCLHKHRTLLQKGEANDFKLFLTNNNT